MIEIDVYRIGPRRRSGPGLLHPTRRDWWRLFWQTDHLLRSWQAEWEGCQRAVRGWTEDGTRRKAIRKVSREGMR